MTTDLSGLPETIGRYQVRALLGQGGMGRVVLGYDPVLRREVALKLVEPSAVAPENLAELRYMFHREARATAALRHPGIVEIYDYSGPDAELLFLACERLDGPTLRDVLEERGRLTPELVASLGHELALALDHAHERDIIHRDLKPENIFWLESGRIVLSDFGIAKAMDGSGRLGNTVRYGTTNLYGSPAYMAPEQLTGGATGPASDLHALGAVMYEALTGTQPFSGESVEAILDAVLSDTRPSLSGRTDIPEQPANVITALLAREPSDRPASARAVATALREALDFLEVTDPRTALRDSGNVPGSAELEEETEPNEMFAQEQPRGIQARPAKTLATGSRLAALLNRGPVVLGMLGVAVLLGAGAYMFVELSELPGRAQLFPAPVVVTDPDRAGTAVATGDVFVLIRFPGRAAVWIDGEEIGVWEEQVRLALPAGEHTLEVRSDEGSASKEVLLLPDTSPVFDLVPMAETAPPIDDTAPEPP